METHGKWKIYQFYYWRNQAIRREMKKVCRKIHCAILLGVMAFLFFRPALATSDEEKFIRIAVDKIHGSLRLAAFISDFQLACLTDDKQWFAQNTVRPLLYRQITCPLRIDSLKEDIKQRYPLMIKLLVVYHYRDIMSMARYLEEGSEEQFKISHAQNQYTVRHLFPGLKRLPPPTMHQVKEAIKILQEETICQGVDLDCYEKEYRALLVGKEDRIPGLPILGFITSAEPEDEELIQAIKEIRKNTRALLEDFRQKYFIVEDGNYLLKEPPPKNPRIHVSVERFSIKSYLDLFQFAGILKNSISKESEEFQALFDRGFARWESRESKRLWMEMTVLLTWTGGCMAFFRSPLALQTCIIPTGLGANLYFFTIDNKKYQEAMDIALYRADDGAPTYQDISMLEDLAFARTLSIIMLPFFTEVPRLANYFRSSRHQRKVLKGSKHRILNTGKVGTFDKTLKGSLDNKKYKIWNRKKSSTHYQVLLDHTAEHPHFLRMGAAIIDDNLIRHQHKESEIYYFLGGKGVAYLGKPGKEIKVPVRKGTFLHIPSGVPHYTKADPDSPLELLYIFPRHSVEDIEYVFDGTLKNFEKNLLVGDVSELPKSLRSIHREIIIGGARNNRHSTDLSFGRVAVPWKKKISEKAALNTIVFVNEGRGVITTGSEKIDVEKGSYLLIPKGHRYIVENGASERLDLLLFERNFK